MKRYRYALIGCGRIAKRHLAAARENAGRLSLTALCDLLPEKARSLGESWQADPPAAEQPPPGVFSGHRELLEKAEPEICAIAAESGAHARIALDCIEAGCHVLIEKRYPHHGAVAFGHYGKALFEVFKYLGVADIAYNQPKNLPYPTENPFC